MPTEYDVIRVLRCSFLFDGCPRKDCEDEDFCLFVVNKFHNFFIHRILLEWEYNKRIKRPSFEELLERVRKGEDLEGRGFE